MDSRGLGKCAKCGHPYHTSICKVRVDNDSYTSTDPCNCEGARMSNSDWYMDHAGAGVYERERRKAMGSGEADVRTLISAPGPNKTTTYAEVKDSGTRQTFESGAIRDIQEGKGRYDLIPVAPLKRLARHYENGAKKYGEHNWEKGIPSSRYYDSAMRHLISYKDGDRSEDHLSAINWNVFGIIWNEEHRPDLDDLSGKNNSK